MSGVKVSYEKRLVRLQATRESLDAFFRSTGAIDLIELLEYELLPARLMSDDPHMTSYNLGIHNSIQTIKQLQTKARGE